MFQQAILNVGDKNTKPQTLSNGIQSYIDYISSKRLDKKCQTLAPFNLFGKKFHKMKREQGAI